MFTHFETYCTKHESIVANTNTMRLFVPGKWERHNWCWDVLIAIDVFFTVSRVLRALSRVCWVVVNDFVFCFIDWWYRFHVCVSCFTIDLNVGGTLEGIILICDIRHALDLTRQRFIRFLRHTQHQVYITNLINSNDMTVYVAYVHFIKLINIFLCYTAIFFWA